MANNIFSIIPANTTDAGFRGWGSALSAQLGLMLTRVVTSNDIDWLTVVTPTTTSQMNGFEVYRFNDAAQATHPIFFKIEYGAGTSAATAMGIRLTIAKACDAAGVLSGILLAPALINSASTVSSSAQTSYISSSDSHFSWALCVPLSTAIGGALVIERAVNSNGSINGDALWVSYKLNNQDSNSWNNVFIAYTAGSANTLSNNGIFPAPLVLTTGQSLANGATTPYFPAACLAPNGLYWIPRAALGGSLVDCAAGVVINSLLDGNNYIGVGPVGGNCDQRNNAYSGMLMRW